MNRRGFFASLGAVLIVPFLPGKKPEQTVVEPEQIQLMRELERDFAHWDHYLWDPGHSGNLPICPPGWYPCHGQNLGINPYQNISGTLAAAATCR